MKIIKRNGSEAVFDITKIISAITKANKVVPEAQRLTKQQIIEISDNVQEAATSGRLSGIGCNTMCLNPGRVSSISIPPIVRYIHSETAPYE